MEKRNIMLEVAEEAVHSAVYFAKRNLRNVGTFIDLTAPYLMYFLGQGLALDRGQFAVGGELFVPIALWFVAGYLKGVANKMNKGKRIPKPEKRFTEVDEDGIVSIEEERVEELLVYMADLEDWMERKGWL